MGPLSACHVFVRLALPPTVGERDLVVLRLPAAANDLLELASAAGRSLLQCIIGAASDRADALVC